MKAEFKGPISTRWVDGERGMVLLEFTRFIDAKGRKWTAAPGDYIDGASIPRFFWRFIGGPFTGKYRRASVYHDVYCKSRKRPSAKCHKMFHEAMLADGVPKHKAWTMYQAVARFGPKWKVKG